MIKNKLFLLLNYRLRRLSYIEKSVSYNSSCEIISSELHGKVILAESVKLYGVKTCGKIIIGRYTSCWGPNINILSELNSIEIGNFCSIASDVTIQESYHNHQFLTTYHIGKNVLGLKNDKTDFVSKGPIKIGHDVWIGKGAKIMSGVSIGTGAVVGANAIVTKDVPPYAIVAGCPAKVVKYRFDEGTVARLLKSEWWNIPIDKIKSLYKYLNDVDESLRLLNV